MFDLLKDVDKYKGVPPYASELYGVYQPLLGWQSNLTKKWIQRGGATFDPRVKRILDGHIMPAPTDVEIRQNGALESMVAKPLQPGSGRSPYTVLLARDLNSELINLLRNKIQAFVDANNGRLPQSNEWTQVIDINNLMDQQNGDLRKVNDIHFKRIQAEVTRRALDGQLTTALISEAKRTHLEVMQYESQIAAFLLFHAEAHAGFDPDELKKLFYIKTASPLADILRPSDPLANIDPNDNSGALSPVGFMNLFRQYFFDLGTFLGEPVEHVWLSPGATIELVEISTRKILVEQQFESSVETTTRSEQTLTLKDELSDAVKEENQNSTKLGVTQSNTVKAYIYQGTATANLGMESTRTEGRETAHKQNREQSEKLSTEIKRSFKTMFRTSTETTDTRSRRHVIQNPNNKVLNYELRRKMRRVGVQVQDLGTRLCWQVFIDDPGAEVGVAQLVHVAEPADLSQVQVPELTPYPADVKQPMKLMLPFQRFKGDNDTGTTYVEDSPLSETGHVHLGDTNDKIKVNYLGNSAAPPPGTRLANVLVKSIVGGHHVDPVFFNLKDNSFDVHLRQAHFPVEGLLTAELELVFVATEDEKNKIDTANASVKREIDAAKRQAIKDNYIKNIKERIKLASSIQRRPSWDLREEERTVVYRQLLKRLMLDSWSLDPQQPEHKRLNHVRSEVIRAIFDVDSMLYFVAPEWWMPRLHRSRQSFNPSPVLDADGKEVPVSESDPVGWGGIREFGRDNYKITEDSAPARLGSSLGWLLQLDGDNLRNAFLNAPWVKAVIPIRPGRETAALNWLRAIEGHEQDGWDVPYAGTEPEFAGQTMGQVLETIADRLQQQNGDIKNVLEADKVFEKGFDHLAGGFDAGLDANQVFSQWISVLPTDQIVATDYKPLTFEV